MSYNYHIFDQYIKTFWPAHLANWGGRCERAHMQQIINKEIDVIYF